MTKQRFLKELKEDIIRNAKFNMLESEDFQGLLKAHIDRIYTSGWCDGKLDINQNQLKS